MKKALCVLLVIAVSLGFSACTGSERLKNMTIVQGMALDEENGDVTVLIQYLDLNKGSGKNDTVSGNITSTVSGKGSSIENAIKNAGKKLPVALFFGQNKIIILSSDFEKRFRREFKKYIIKSKESRPDVLVVKSRGSAAEVLKKSQQNTRIPADSICKQLEKAHRDVTVNEYLAGDKLHLYG